MTNKCTCGKSANGICDGSHNTKSNSMIKSLAFVRPKATGNPKVDKAFGQIRHIAESPLSVMLFLGLAAKFNLDITPDSWAAFWNITSTALDSIFVTIGAIGKLVIHASSWYSKDEA